MSSRSGAGGSKRHVNPNPDDEDEGPASARMSRLLSDDDKGGDINAASVFDGLL